MIVFPGTFGHLSDAHLWFINAPMNLELLNADFAWCFVYRIWSIYARSTTGMNMSKSFGGTRCVGLSTGISHFYRLTQCRDLGG